MTPHSSAVSPLSIGVLAHSRKENEHRLAIHPAHLAKINPAVRQQIYLESGYGLRFGVPDSELVELVGGIERREQLIARCDVILLPKVQASDLAEMRVGQIVWGWPHCVQDRDLTQIAVDRRLTLIAFEAMNHWAADGGYGLHVFHKNNELAGYCSVLHALELAGSTGDYGRRLRASVIGFGATARGAVTALNAHGVDDVHVLTTREVAAVASPIHSTQITQLDTDPDGAMWADTDRGRVPLARFLAERDIVVNCVLQNPDQPLMFLHDKDLAGFVPGSLIVDVSCDEAMGFEWARPSTFADPVRTVGRGVQYYAVDHSPSYLWNSATWEISDALLPHLETVLGGPTVWQFNPIIDRAIEIRDGVVENPSILSFQHRGADYPHDVVHKAPSVSGSDISPVRIGQRVPL